MPELARNASRPASAEVVLSTRVRSTLLALVGAADRARSEAIEPAAVYDAAIGLILQVAFLFWADAPVRSKSHPSTVRARAVLDSLADGIGDVQGALGAIDDLLSEHFGERARELSFAERPTWVDGAALREAMQHLLASSDGSAIDGSISAEQMGRVYEELLQMRVERLEGAAVCVKPSGHWIVAQDVLEQQPEHRSKWLQRICGMSKSAVQALGDSLRRARNEAQVVTALAPYRLKGTEVMPAGRLVLQASALRRQSGSHYTPAPLARAVIEKALSPFFAGDVTSERILGLRVCDPAMGSGVFLVHTCEFLAGHLVRTWRRERAVGAGDDDAELTNEARRTIAEHCLYGVDRNATAVRLARLGLSLYAGAPDKALSRMTEHLVVGDALVGLGMPPVSETAPTIDVAARREHERLRQRGLLAVTEPLHWAHAFRDVFERSPAGFDAFVGNPPWVAYAGRAAQPLDERLQDYYKDENPAFGRYRSLQGLFIRRAASLLRRGGRVGLVLPTSVADLDGYGPARSAHDALCDVDAELLDFGDGAFAGVFQPCMALTSTRRATDGAREDSATATWSLARNDLDRVASRLLERLSSLSKLDGRLFGERGFQTTGNDLAHLRRLLAPRPPYIQPLREGADIGECTAKPPTLFADPEPLVGRFRGDAAWRSVRLLIRQTARYPLAALSDGLPFRNSILAAFSDARWSEFALLCYLNSSLVRWFHYFCHRDARQGMPQLKIGHLRRLPDLPRSAGETLSELDRLGRIVGPRNEGLLPLDRCLVDELVFRAHGLDEHERKAVTEWARKTPPPKPRETAGAPR